MKDLYPHVHAPATDSRTQTQPGAHVPLAPQVTELVDLNGKKL